MGFTSNNEIVISGGKSDERGQAAAALLASESIDEDSATRRETADSLVLRFDSADGLPEGDIAALAPQFPGLSFSLVYFSLDGEFYGYSTAGAQGDAADSEDFAEDTRDLVARRHDGDRMAFVKERFSLGRAAD